MRLERGQPPELEPVAATDQLFRALIDALPDFIFVKDRRGHFVTVNHSLLDALGSASHDEVVGKADCDFHPEEMAQAFAADDESVMASGADQISHEEVHCGLPEGALGGQGEVEPQLRQAKPVSIVIPNQCQHFHGTLVNRVSHLFTE